MSLKLKISLGYAAVCLIFVAVCALLSFYLVEIGRETHMLRGVILPGAEQAAFLRYSITLEGLNMTEFSSGGLDQNWQNAMAARKDNTDGWGRLRQHLEEIAQRNPAVKGMEASAWQSYQDYQGVTNALPNLVKTSGDAWQSASAAYANYLKAFGEYNTPMTDRMTDYLRRGAAIDDLRLAYDRVERATELSRLASNFYLDIVMGLYLKDLTKLDESLKYGQELKAEITQLRDDSVQQANKDRLQNMLNAFDLCLQSLTTLRANLGQTNDNREQRVVKRLETIQGISNLADAFAAITEGFTDTTISTVDSTRNLLIAAALFSVLIAVVISFFLIRSIVLPLNDIIRPVLPWTACRSR
jgi:hypothetical protein